MTDVQHLVPSPNSVRAGYFPFLLVIGGECCTILDRHILSLCNQATCYLSHLKTFPSIFSSTSSLNQIFSFNWIILMSDQTCLNFFFLEKTKISSCSHISYKLIFLLQIHWCAFLIFFNVWILFASHWKKLFDYNT